jgi:hypothetical protein
MSTMADMDGEAMGIVPADPDDAIGLTPEETINHLRMMVRRAAVYTDALHREHTRLKNGLEALLSASGDD